MPPIVNDRVAWSVGLSVSVYSEPFRQLLLNEKKQMKAQKQELKKRIEELDMRICKINHELRKMIFFYGAGSVPQDESYKDIMLWRLRSSSYHEVHLSFIWYHFRKICTLYTYNLLTLRPI